MNIRNSIGRGSSGIDNVDKVCKAIPMSAGYMVKIQKYGVRLPRNKSESQKHRFSMFDRVKHNNMHIDKNSHNSNTTILDNILRNFLLATPLY